MVIKKKRTNAEIEIENSILRGITPQSPYDVITELEARITILQSLLTQARRNEARLIVMVDSFLDKQESAA